MSIVRSLLLATVSIALAACANNNLPYLRATMFPGAKQQKRRVVSTGGN